MGIAEEFFKRYTPNYKQLEEYGFVKNDKSYSFECLFLDNKFKAKMEISADKKILDTVFDIENDEEYLPLRIKYQEGSYTAKVRNGYEKLLSDIREKCFSKNYFIYPQSNRITNLIIEKYGDYPEFLWEKFDGSGIFRNPQTKKWYAAILNVNRTKLEKGKNITTEVLNIKLEPEKIQDLILQKGFYPAYHMNKKLWISILMEDIVPDNLITELVENSHQYTVKINKV